jgi:hypothetical protein
MADSLDQLFDHIVRAHALKDDLVEIDLNAKASESGADIDAAKQETLRREVAVANDLRQSFRSGIALALAHRQQGIDAITLRDSAPEEDAQADALIRYLVSFGLASSRSDQRAPGQYTYDIAVNWEALRSLCVKAGIDFDQAMSDAGGASA